MSEKEYQVFRLNPDKISVLYGAVLIVFAVLVSSISESKSLTSYIPAMMGSPIFIFGLLSLRLPAKQKLFMHLNVLIGLFIFLGGLSVVGSLFSGTLFAANFWADFSRLFMSITGAVYLTVCIKSFIFIRKQRENSAAEDAEGTAL
tara:strand:- start:246 stop:683 length:438 start_codon:yes stop_codon:yes gene_type:complete